MVVRELPRSEGGYGGPGPCDDGHVTRFLGSVLLLGAALVAAPRARADVGPLLVVVESAEPRQAEAIRRDVGVGLAVEVVTMDDPRARVARGILMIAVVDGGRRALLFYRSRDGFSAWREASAADGGPAAWIAEAAVALAGNAGQWRLQMEVLDPFGPAAPGPPSCW